jgi:hypothetical protein
MKIVYLHYHLKAGGVTSVIRQQIASLPAGWQAMVISGEPAPTDFPAETIHLPAIAYDHGYRASAAPEAVAQDIFRAIDSHLDHGCDMVHVHNPTLAKNRNFLAILRSLQAAGTRLLLQVHDFAEDGRPSAYFKEAYPRDCAYAVINSRDHAILLSAGLKKEGLYQIPNCVTLATVLSGCGQQQNRVLYPVRAIRRKNIGEAILISLFFRNGEQLAITLPPNSPDDQASCSDWQQLAENLGLNVVFGVGLNENFSALVASAKFILTTSITEGFGFCFLEPWLHGKLLWGRRLPEICADFQAAGVNLDHLYPRLAIPVDWIDRHSFFCQWERSFLAAGEKFSYAVDRNSLQTAFQSLIINDTIDFGLLGEAFQRNIIRRLIGDASSKARLILLNPFLGHPGNMLDRRRVVDRNRKAVEEAYGPSAYASKLIDTYRAVLRTPVSQAIDKPALLSAFLKPDTFSLLKWSSYAEQK